MIKISVKIVACFCLLLLSLPACKQDYLEYDHVIDGTLGGPEIWRSNEHARGFLNTVYFGAGNSINRFGESSSDVDLAVGRFGELNRELSFAAGSDEAVSANLGSRINILNNGSWGPTRTYDPFYGEGYHFLRRANLFLENAPTSAIRPIGNSDIASLMGEAYFLRAFFHFELMKRYGAIILATRSFSIEDNLNQPKNTFEEVVAQIVADCDEAAARIPAATTAQQSGTDKGRATKAAALALKARALLYAASPLNNPAGDPQKWQAAADAAEAVMDGAGAGHGLLTYAQLPNLWNYGSLPFNQEVIFAAQSVNTAIIDNTNAPPSYNNGLGRTNPTQELVDAFEMRTTGKVPVVDGVADPSSGYNPANPYANRDSRLALFINYHGKVFRNVPINVIEGQKDNNPSSQVGRVTQTGYYLGKYMSTGTGANRKAWVYLRYAEVLLNYAEALNEAQGPVPEVYAAINLVRQRPGSAAASQNPPLQSTNPAGPAYVERSKEAMRLRIQNERRVELCFEDHRFFDVRRWQKGEEFLNKPVTGMRITGSGTNLTYTRFVVQTRVFRPEMYRFPFPQTELNFTPNLEQNAGWN